jgi:hypothetical protein
MVSNSVPSDFWGYFRRYLNRFVFSNFQSSGIDQFTVAPAANPNKFLQLTNVLPAVSGGFARRWGLAPVSGASVTVAPERMFAYQAKADTTVSGTEDTYLILGANTGNLNILLSEVNGTPPYSLGAASAGEASLSTHSTHYSGATSSLSTHGGSISNPSNPIQQAVDASIYLPSSAILRGVTSRNWFYAAYGTLQGQKIDFSQRTANTASNWGIPAPGAVWNSSATPPSGSTLEFISIAGCGQFTSVPSVSISGGGGSGAAATANCTGTNLQYVLVTNGGSGYTSSPTVLASGGGGSGATFAVNLTSGVISGIVVVDQGTGYTSAPTITISGGGGSGAAATGVINMPYLVIESFTLTNFGSGYTSAPTVTVSGGGAIETAQALAILGTNGAGTEQVGEIVPQGTIPLIAGRNYSYAWGNSVTGHYSDILYTPWTQSPYSQSGQASYSGIYVTLVAMVPDTQIDNVELLATSDGGSLQYLYGLANNSVSGSFLVWNYVDTTPDTVNENYSTGPTLLTNDLWVDVDSYGNPIGIAGNQPPQATLNCPVVNQGRMFMTDGAALYYSKSIDEVTTSTGLITSKWEEAWPGDSEIDLISDNERIVGLLSANGSLYIGTTQNIIILTGSNAESFSAQIAFHNTGLLSPDLWTLIYKENMPIGMMWVTPDYKIMFSDFSSYENVGLGVYPIMAALSNSDFAVSSLQSVVWGPYSFVAFNYLGVNGAEFLLFDTVGRGWYQWTGANFGNSIGAILSYTNYSGITNLYMAATESSGTSALGYFLPTQAYDSAILGFSQVNIPWTIQTTWQSFEDATAYKVLNELEAWTNESATTVSVYAANSPADYLNASLTPIKTGSLVTSPLGASKLYLAGTKSKARYYNFLFSCSNPGTNPQVLDQFTVEAYTMSRL